MNAQLENERDTETYCRLAGLTDSMPATLIAEMVSDRGRPIASFRAKVLGSPSGQSESPNVSVSEIMISQIHGLIIFISLSKEQFWGYIPFSDKLLDPSMKLFQSFHFVSKHLAVSSEANEILGMAGLPKADGCQFHKGDWILQRPGHVYGAVFDPLCFCLCISIISPEFNGAC